MLLQFLIGGVASVISIVIHALVTVGVIGIARSVGLRNARWPRLHLMVVMVGAATSLMVAHTLEVFATRPSAQRPRTAICSTSPS